MSHLTDGQDAQKINRTKKSLATPSSSPGTQGTFSPTSFFLRTERDLERDTQHGRPASSSSTNSSNGKRSRSRSSPIRECSFGVQSLEDTLASTFGSAQSDEKYVKDSVRRTSDQGRKPQLQIRPPSRIDTAGLSPVSVVEQPNSPPAIGVPIHSSSPGSVQSCISPTRPRGRRMSDASSINISHPLTPLRMSPHTGSAIAATSRSGSPKSFQLSDDERSVNDQAVHSDEEDDGQNYAKQEEGQIHNLLMGQSQSSTAQPQFVMPSLPLPARRPFTQRGQQIGKLKLLVVGRSGSGRSSLIQSLLRVCEDIVHADAPTNMKTKHTRAGSQDFIETLASTRSRPTWWMEPGQSITSSRRKSFSGATLERNIYFLDCPSVNVQGSTNSIREYVQSSLEMSAALERVCNGSALQILSGMGSPVIDGIIWLFDPQQSTEGTPDLTEMENELLELGCKTGNVIPIIGHSDAIPHTEMVQRKAHLRDMLTKHGFSTYSLTESEERPQGSHDARPVEPFAISSALSDDSETIDASVLMSSQYVQPFIDSDLRYFAERLFDPDNVARMRHMAAVKVMEWRWQQQTTIARISTHTSALHRTTTNSIASTSGRNEDDKILVPYRGGRSHRSASPSISEVSALSAPDRASSRYTPYGFTDDRNLSPEPFRRVRLAKWAQDLQRSLENERQRCKLMYDDIPAEWQTGDGDKTQEQEQALVVNANSNNNNNGGRAPRGRLGGAVAVIDPNDPLGILAWSQTISKRGQLMVQLAGGFGVMGMLALWVMRNWCEVQEFLGQSPAMIHASAIPAPTRNAASWMDGASWRGLLGWNS